MSSYDNNVNRKLRKALRRSRAAAALPGLDPQPNQRLPPVKNFYARVSDGHVLIACHGRPDPDLIWKQYEMQKARRQAEAQAKAERLAAQREAQQKNLLQIVQSSPRPNRLRRRLLAAVTAVAAMAGLTPARA